VPSSKRNKNDSEKMLLREQAKNEKHKTTRTDYALNNRNEKA